MLLSDTRVQKYLSEHFVTAWESVGPVPQVTIDFGNGKTLKRTLGGNTVLSVLLPDGATVDALPGVYTPEAFLSETQGALELIRSLGGARAAMGKDGEITRWHRAAVDRQLNPGPITGSKAIVESPILRLMVGDALPGLNKAPGEAPPLLLPGRNLGGGLPLLTNTQRPAAPLRTEELLPPPREAREYTPEEYGRAFEVAAGKVSDLSKRPMTAEQVRRQMTPQPPGAKPLTAEQVGQLMVQIDSRTNLRVVRPVVHLLLAAQAPGKLPDARACRDVVYEKVLHIPLNDPYLGLADALVPGTPAPGE